MLPTVPWGPPFGKCAWGRASGPQNHVIVPTLPTCALTCTATFTHSLSLSMRCIRSSNPRYNVTDYAVFATANLLLSFLLPNVTDPGYLRSVFQAGTPPFAAASKQPCLQHVRGVSAALLVVEA